MKYDLLFFTIFVFFVTDCKKENDPEPELVFTICPVDTAAISEASPLGNINPPGHTFPSDHIGFYIRGENPIPVRCMAPGRIITVYYNEWSDDYRIELKHSEQYMFYLDHLSDLPSGIVSGSMQETGDILGYARPGHGAFDIGVINYEIVHNYISPERYLYMALKYDDPYKYFTDSIRTILERKNPRIGEPKGGKADFDIDGTLSGNWFLDGTPFAWEAGTYLYGDRQLAFVYDMYNASAIMISCGGTLQGAPFAYRVYGNNPDPASVTVNSGIIMYPLIAYTKDCTMLVEMTEDRKIRVQVFDLMDSTEVTGFTDPKIYVR